MVKKQWPAFQMRKGVWDEKLKNITRTIMKRIILNEDGDEAEDDEVRDDDEDKDDGGGRN